MAPSLLQDYRETGVRHITTAFRAALADQIELTLPRVEAPTLVVRGEHDRMVPQVWAEEVTRLLPRGQLVTLSKAAHMLPFSHPARLAAAVERFVEQT